MEIRVTLNGTEAEADELFKNFNIRLMKPLSSGRYEVLIRVCEDFNEPKTTSMKKMIESLTAQGERFTKK